MANRLLKEAKLKKGASPDKVLVKNGWPKNTHLKILQKNYNIALMGHLAMSVGGRARHVKPDTKVFLTISLYFPKISLKEYKELDSAYKVMIKLAADAQTQVNALDPIIKEIAGPRETKEADLKRFGAKIRTYSTLLNRMDETCEESAKKCAIQSPASSKMHKTVMRLYKLLEDTRKDLEKFDKSKKGKLLKAYKSLKRDLTSDVKVFSDFAKDFLKEKIEYSFLMP